MPNRLEEIELEEISLVDVPATKRKFLFTKAAGNGSYLVCKCGHEEALVDFLKSASEECPGCGESLEDSAVKIITKGKGVNNMKKKLSELIKDFIGEDELTDEEMEELEKAEKVIPPAAGKALKAVVATLSKFKADFPDEIKECINTLAKYAAYGYGYPAKKEKKDEEEDEDVEKAGAKLSKATRELIKNAVEKYKTLEKAIVALESLIKSDTQKSAEILLIEEKMDNLSEKMDKLFEKKAEVETEAEKKKKTKTKKKKGEDEEEEEEEEEEEVKKDEEEVRKDLKAIAERVEHLEEKKGTKKSLKGQDEEESESKWPSFFKKEESK